MEFHLKRDIGFQCTEVNNEMKKVEKSEKYMNREKLESFLAKCNNLFETKCLVLKQTEKYMKIYCHICKLYDQWFTFVK